MYSMYVLVFACVHVTETLVMIGSEKAQCDKKVRGRKKDRDEEKIRVKSQREKDIK